jgi:hypothetical protein
VKVRVEIILLYLGADRNTKEMALNSETGTTAQDFATP